MSDADNNRRELLERSANRTRERLVDTLSELDHRRHDVTDVHKQIAEHKKPIVLGGLAIVLAVGTAIGVSIYHLATRRERVRRERWRALHRLWEHPERVARKKVPKGTLASEIGRKVITSALTFVALELTKRTVRRALTAGDFAPRQRVVVRTLPA
jgi:hypothetical protein